MNIFSFLLLMMFLHATTSLTRTKYAYMARVIVGSAANVHARDYDAVIVSEKLLLTCHTCLSGRKDLFGCVLNRCNQITKITKSPEEDIAILEMKRAFPKIVVHKPIQLISSTKLTPFRFKDGDCIEIGYEVGVTQHYYLEFFRAKKNKNVKYRLFKNKIMIMGKKECNKKDNVLCVKGTPGKRCPDDGGSALVCKGYLVGIKLRGQKGDDCKIDLYANVMNIKIAA